MPVFRAAEAMAQPAEGEVTAVVLLDRGFTASDHCIVKRFTIPRGKSLHLRTGNGAVSWFMVLAGVGQAASERIDGSTVGFAGPGGDFAIAATEDDLDILWTEVPRAGEFDADISSLGGGLKIIDWWREPVLQSEHDQRQRIYLATPALVGTEAIKAEMITYPPGAAAPDHHHEGAEHFQFVISGVGTAVLNGREQPMTTGDILYNYEHERHYFFTDPEAAEAFVFVEFFIPGHCTTVWAEGANACAWLPTGKDHRGEAPVREIGYHRHGEGSGI